MTASSSTANQVRAKLRATADAIEQGKASDIEREAVATLLRALADNRTAQSHLGLSKSTIGRPRTNHFAVFAHWIRERATGKSKADAYNVLRGTIPNLPAERTLDTWYSKQPLTTRELIRDLTEQARYRKHSKGYKRTVRHDCSAVFKQMERAARRGL
jgi:hypothetical protein